MKRSFFLWCTKIVLVFSLVLPVSVGAQSVSSSESAYRALLLQLIATLQEQIVVLQQQLAAEAYREQPQVSDEVGPLGAVVDMVATYPLARGADVSAIKDRDHREYFERVFTLFPDEYGERLGRLAVFTEESAAFDAFVETIPPTHERWMYAVNEELVDDADSDSNTELIVHELAHLISYDERAGSVSAAYGRCESYFSERGCPETSSYLRAFVDTFWSNQDLARAERYNLLNDDNEAAYAYYERHQSEFVSDYAAIAPEEDFAESFMYFALERDTKSGKAEQKVNFFEQYAELITIKDGIAVVK